MDAEELPEALAESKTVRGAGRAACPCVEAGAPASCRSECAFEVVDGLLSRPGAVTGEEVDCLLDFRQVLQRRQDAEALLRLFCELRRRLERRHYLPIYRLRRWLENQIKAEVSSPGGGPAVAVPLHLGFYCVEAVRRVCLCTASARGIPLAESRLVFSFARRADRNADL